MNVFSALHDLKMIPHAKSCGAPLIDRRFYRYKYDAARTLVSFSTTLQNEMDLVQLQERLVSVIAETIQPTHVSLSLFRMIETEATSEPSARDTSS
jgi:hypothetical protein